MADFTTTAIAYAGLIAAFWFINMIRQRYEKNSIEEAIHR